MQQLRVTRQKYDMIIAGAGDMQGPCTRGVTVLQMKSRHNPDFSLRVNAFVLTKITAELPNRRIRTDQWQHLRGLQLSDPNFGNPGEIDLLIGADVWGHVVRDGITNGQPNEPHAQNTHLGWVVSGPVDVTHCHIAHTHFARDNAKLEEALTRFWQLEEPTPAEIGTQATDECEQQYISTVHRQANGRYVVDVPFLPDQPKLGDSQRMSTQQFYRNERRMHSDPELLAKYIAFMREYEALGHMAIYDGEIGEGAVYFIPHHSVSVDVKFRVVFNASAKTSNGVSLNETQHTGPTVQDKLANIILRFRLFRIAMVADVEKMFRQVMVNQDHQRWQLIRWREHPSKPLKTYRLTTVTYGTRSGPYLAVRTLIQCARDNHTVIASTEEAEEARKSIERDFYVDDSLTSTSTTTNAIRRAQNVDKILRQGHMHLRKWQSNRSTVVEAMAGEKGPGKLALPINPTETSVLGVQWDSASDTLSFDITLAEATTRTKRTCLSDIAKLYDPTGLLTPVVVVAKIFMQKLWLAGLSWDEEIPKDLIKEWYIYRQSLFTLSTVEIPRHVGLHPGGEITLHGFCDASSHAYAAVIYVRTVNDQGKVTTRILTSKSRVAPVKTVSIPRLELCGAQLLVTTMNSVREAIELTDVEYCLWTDSTIVLAWLRHLPVRFKPYVANRVGYVQQHSEPSAWHHIPTAHNPADCASRGLSVAQLRTHKLWWNGPEFLQRGNHYSAADEPVCTADDQESMRAEEKAPVLLHARLNSRAALHTWRADGVQYNLLDRTNSLIKLKRIVAHLLYAIRNRRKHPKGEICTAARLLQAEQAVAYLDQRQWFKPEIEACDNLTGLPAGSTLTAMNPFIDTEGILRVGGRLQNAILDSGRKYPIILAKDSRLASIIVANTHQELLHGGVQIMLHSIRRSYWIMGGRALVKSHVNKCIVCRLHRGAVAKQKMGDLPSQRVNRHRPFSISGIDYCGPFTLRVGEKRSRKTTKAYVAIFVCLATKAVHIELATDLSTDAFLNAFARFTGRRGPCEQLHSDNGTNFHGANRRMQEDLKEWHTQHVREKLAHQGTTWKFIPPAAPHQGGIWEAAVRIAKRHLIRVVGNHTMSYEQFNTLLIRIEACLNSRPLVALHDDPDDRLALTPGDFLTGGPIIAAPEPTQLQLPLNRVKEWNLVRRWNDDIWQRWQTEYLSTLQERGKWRNVEDNIKINDIVAIKQENLPPTQWCIGRVIEVHPGKDGLVRVVTTQHVDKTTGRTYTRQRPIQKICILLSENYSEPTGSEEARMSQSEMNSNALQTNNTNKSTALTHT